MSQHLDIVKHCLATAIKHNMSFSDTMENLNGTLCAADYDEEFECHSRDELFRWVKMIILSQQDGLYGVSHAEVNEWMKKEL